MLLVILCVAYISVTLQKISADDHVMRGIHYHHLEENLGSCAAYTASPDFLFMTV